MYEIEVATNGITFIRDTVKISKLTQKLKGDMHTTQGQHGDILRLLSSLRKENKLKICTEVASPSDVP
jgi:hypothetical protein